MIGSTMKSDDGSSPLEHITADRRIIDELYSHGKITMEAREYALEALYPHNHWGLWVSRILLTLGTLLVLSGIVYFFAFNWTKITPTIKLFSIQFGLVGCLVGAWFYSLRRLTGQILLLSASMLVGVFFAVFGQVYQTGADAYQLFMMWALLTLGWTLISNFAPQWVFWLVIANTSLILWWEQAALPSHEMKHLIHTYMALLNGAALGLREYLSAKKTYAWLKGRWTRGFLVIGVLSIVVVPIISLITGEREPSISVMVSGAVGFVAHGLVFYLYRFKFPDMWSLAAAVLSACIIVETVIVDTMVSDRLLKSESITFLVMGIATIILFACAVAYLSSVSKKMKVDHVSS
ncbi:conserved membrane protein of unknown function [Pseudodesulfovibrio profundus]|uniref:DUF2157 domain-containing protein n=2 Tax=Pseudodesulfovibrio profundus TaxID=57320 RepID=A0A2C8FBZ0_9BACT|nr:conserved membrane protein of unknown function [Pseudodesulfovibrio profundus]